MYMHIRYVQRKRPPFSTLNFRSRAYHFHKWHQKKNPLWSITILHFLPLQRPSFSKCLYLQAIHHRPRPAYCSQPECKAFGQCPRVTAGQSASQTRPTKSVPETRIFTVELTPELCIFMLNSVQSPHFSLCRGTYIPKFGVSAPSPWDFSPY